MKPVVSSILVDKPRGQVFEYLDVLANHEAFLDHFLVNWSFSGPARGVGAKARARTDAPGGQDWTEFEVIEVEPGERIVEEGIGPKGKRHTRGIYRLSDGQGGGTQVEFELEWLKASKAERMIPALTHAFVKRPNAKAMRRLKKILES